MQAEHVEAVPNRVTIKSKEKLFKSEEGDTYLSLQSKIRHFVCWHSEMSNSFCFAKTVQSFGDTFISAF